MAKAPGVAENQREKGERVMNEGTLAKTKVTMCEVCNTDFDEKQPGWLEVRYLTQQVWMCPACLGRNTLGIEIVRFMHLEQQEFQPESRKGEIGSMFHDESIKGFFDRMRRQVKDSYEGKVTDGSSTQIGDKVAVESRVLTEAEKAVWIKDDLIDIEKMEADFDEWLHHKSPLAMFEKDLNIREVSRYTKRGWLGHARVYMEAHDWNTTFEREELMSYLNQLTDLKNKGVISVHTLNDKTTALHAWWDAMMLNWPTRRKKRGTSRSKAQQQKLLFKKELPWGKEAIRKSIAKVKGCNNAQYKYLWCLFTTWAPRPGENEHDLTEGSVEEKEQHENFISPRSWVWNEDGSGTLTFDTQKGSNPRQHHVPKELAPYLKEYSKAAPSLTTKQLNFIFHQMNKELALGVPESPLKKYPDRLGNHKREKGINFHYFRHPVETYLTEAGVNLPDVNVFFGWVPQPGTAGQYYIPNMEKADEVCRKHHPFLKAWVK
ncbi:hypothetical protein ES703_109480 [subsurface metagenome]